MQKLLVFTDIHFVPEGADIIGLDPVARFDQGLAHALSTHPDAARILITGDLAHHGDPEEYARLRSSLEHCPLPIDLMIGNHDDRARFHAAFPERPADPHGYIQFFHDLGAYRLICLDTVDETGPVADGGYLCPDRLDWLCHALSGAAGRRVILFMHHPPIITGFRAMDRIGMRNRDQFRQLLGGHSNICQIVAGHIHRRISGATAGVPVSIFKSPCHQMPMALIQDDEHLSVDEPGAYGLLLLGDEGVIVHTEDFGLPPRAPESYAPSTETPA